MEKRLEQLRIQSIIPRPGDLIFVGTNKIIAAAQFALGVPESKFTHVAIMIGSDKIIEAMKGEEVVVHDFVTWLESEGRRNDVVRTVWRNPEFDITNGYTDLYNNVAYRLGQGYDWSPLKNFSEFQDSHTICSVLALNVILESGILESEIWGVNSSIYPGQLLALIKDNGFEEIDIDDYVEAVRTGIGGLNVVGHLDTIVAMQDFDTCFSDILKNAQGFSSFYRPLSCEDAIRFFARSRIVDGKNFAELFSQDVADFVHFQVERTKLEASRPANWRDRGQHEETLRTFKIASVELARVIISFLSNLATVISSERFLNSEGIFETGSSGNLNNLADLIFAWYAITGCTPEKFDIVYPHAESQTTQQLGLPDEIDPNMLELIEGLYSVAFEFIHGVSYAANLALKRIEAKLGRSVDEELGIILEQKLRERLPRLFLSDQALS